MDKTESDYFQKVAQQDVCRDCPRLLDRRHFWKQILALTACIMGVLVVLSIALAVILTRLYPY